MLEALGSIPVPEKMEEKELKDKILLFLEVAQGSSPGQSSAFPSTCPPVAATSQPDSSGNVLEPSQLCPPE
jgi:hypothetical protein